MHRIPRPSHGCVLSSSLHRDHVKTSRANGKRKHLLCPGLKSSFVQRGSILLSSPFSMGCSELCCSATEKGVLHSGPQRLNCSRLGFLPAGGAARVTGSQDCNFLMAQHRLHGGRDRLEAGERKVCCLLASWQPILSGFPVPLPSCYASACHRPESSGSSWARAFLCCDARPLSQQCSDWRTGLVISKGKGTEYKPISNSKFFRQGSITYSKVSEPFYDSRLQFEILLPKPPED